MVLSIIRVLVTFKTFGEKLKSLTYFISPVILLFCEIQLFNMQIFHDYCLEIVLLNGLIYAFLLSKVIASSVSGVYIFLNYLITESSWNF